MDTRQMSIALLKILGIVEGVLGVPVVLDGVINSVGGCNADSVGTASGGTGRLVLSGQEAPGISRMSVADGRSGFGWLDVRPRSRLCLRVMDSAITLAPPRVSRVVSVVVSGSVTLEGSESVAMKLTEQT